MLSGETRDAALSAVAAHAAADHGVAAVDVGTPVAAEAALRSA